MCGNSMFPMHDGLDVACFSYLPQILAVIDMGVVPTAVAMTMVTMTPTPITMGRVLAHVGQV